LQEGFCNYYASAEVILLRSLGIPSRLAVGFAQGERIVPIIPGQAPGAEITPPEVAEGLTSTYVVRQRDAHAWPEVYFPGVGWVEFEPTVSQDALLRPLGGELPVTPLEDESNPLNDPLGPADEPDLLSGLDTPAGTSLQGQFWTPKTIFLMSLMVVSIVLLGYIILQVRRGFRFAPYFERIANDIPVRLERGFIRFGIHPPRFLSLWAQYVKLPSLSRSYMQVNHALNRMGQPPELNETPAERVSHLSLELPLAKAPANVLLDEYQMVTYSQHPADEDAALRAGNEIRKLSYRELFRRWLARFQESPRKPPLK
jgi:hypothetical protein